MRGHIDEQKHAYMSVGMEAEEAEEAAVKEMGDPVEAGSLLERHPPAQDGLGNDWLDRRP